MRALREVLLGVALTAAAAHAQVTVSAAAQTMTVPSFNAADPAVGTYVIGTDGSQTGFYAYELTGAWKTTVPVGLSRSADIRGGLLAVAVPNSGVLFYDEAEMTPYTLPDGGAATLTLASVSLVALGENSAGETLVFANSGSSTLSSFVLGGEALPDVALPGVPRGFAWSDGLLYATVPNALVSVDAAGTVTTLASSNLGAAEGVALVSAGGARYALVASSSESLVHVHRVSGSPEFIGSFAVTWDTSTVTPRGLAANASTLVVHDVLSANYKVVPVSDVVAALQLAGASDDGGTPGVDGGSGGTPTGPAGGPGGQGPSAEPMPMCAVTPSVALLPAVLALLRFRRRFGPALKSPPCLAAGACEAARRSGSSRARASRRLQR